MRTFQIPVPEASPGEWWAEIMDEITREAGRLWEEELGGAPFGQEAQSVSPFVELSTRLTDLAADDRVYGTAENLLGPGFLWAGLVTTRAGELRFEAVLPDGSRALRAYHRGTYGKRHRVKKLSGGNPKRMTFLEFT